jgi:hypothetical protein
MREEGMLEALERISSKQKPDKKKLTIVLVASLLLTAIGLSAAFLFGTYYYHFRRTLLHERRLEGLLREEPSVNQITEGLQEKAPLMASPEAADELRKVAAKWPLKSEEILSKHERWSLTRVYDAGDMIYFIYFDSEGIMRDYIFVDNPDYHPRR